MQTLESGLVRFAQVEIGKQTPARDRDIPDQGLFDLAKPAHEPGYGCPRDPVGQQKI